MVTSKLVLKGISLAGCRLKSQIKSNTQIPKTNFILDQSELELTPTTSDSVDKQGTSRNWAAVCRKTKGGEQREKRKGKSIGLRVGSLRFWQDKSLRVEAGKGRLL